MALARASIYHVQPTDFTNETSDSAMKLQKTTSPLSLLAAASLLAMSAGASAGPAENAELGTCIATILFPARFEMQSEQVLVEPATTREEVVPATYKTVTEKVLVRPETRREVAVPEKLRTVGEEVVVRPAGTRDEPVRPVFSARTEEVQTQDASTCLEVTPPVYEKATARIIDRPEHIVQRVVPAQYREVTETVQIRPASTRTVTNNGAWQAQTQRVMVRPEMLQYVPVKLPTKYVAEKRLRAEATTRVREVAPVFETVTTPVKVRDGAVRHAAVPAAWEIVEERIKVALAKKG